MAQEQFGNRPGYVAVEIYDQTYYLAGEDTEHIRALAALVDARHPLSGERLFSEAFSTDERFGIDPLEKRWPEVIGIPAPGYQVRQRFDRARQLVRPDPAVAAARTGVGFFCWQAPGVSAGEYDAIDLSAVMKIIGGESMKYEV